MTHNQIWNAIDMFAHEHNLSCSGLARFSGLDPTMFNKSKRFYKSGKPRWMSLESIAKILDATHSTPQDLFKFLDDPKTTQTA